MQVRTRRYIMNGKATVTSFVHDDYVNDDDDDDDIEEEEDEAV